MTNEKSSKQSKEYEKERRDRLNAAFDRLSSALPEYDPVNSLSKADILTKAFEYIQKLEADKNKPAEIMEKSCEKENTSLKAKVKHLSSRIRQLMDVMYSAKIKIPENLPPTSTYTPGNHCKWNGKAGDKKVESLLKRVRDRNKENKKNKPKPKQSPSVKSKQVTSQAKNQTRTCKLYRQKKRVFKLVETGDKLGSLSSVTKVVLSIADINAPPTETPLKPVSAPTSVVPLQESNSKVNIVSPQQNTTKASNSAVLNNRPASLISTPIMATGITSTVPIQNLVQNVNLGAYILPNGQLMAVQQPTPIIPQIAPQILINRPVTPVFLMQNNNSITDRPIIIKNNNVICEPFMNNCRPIYPKRKREITRTTFSSQKPIPSLNLNFSSIKCPKQMKTEGTNEQKQKLLSKEHSRLSSVKRFSKNYIKKRSCNKRKKVITKTDKVNSFVKLKRLEKANLKKAKLQRRVKTKNPKSVSNKYTNSGKVANSSPIKKVNTSLGCDVVRSKKANLGSVNKVDNSLSTKTSESSNTDFRSEPSANFAPAVETCDFISVPKSSVSVTVSLSQKGAFSSDTCMAKNTTRDLDGKESCDLQVKINANSSEISIAPQIPSYSAQSISNSFNFDPKLVDSFNFSSSKDVLSQLGTYEKNSFLPILPPYLEDVREFPQDILSSLQIPSNLHNSESLSPTAAFLLSFPLVSTSKNSELLNENENELSCESQNDNSTSILQIGNLESPSSSLIEGQAVLFDQQQYSQMPKPNWLPKSCDKIESNQKYNESLSLNFEGSNVSSVHAPNYLSKKSPVFTNSPCKAPNSKSKSSTSISSSQPCGKTQPPGSDKALLSKKSNIVVTSSNSETMKQNSFLNSSSTSHTVSTCSTKELCKTTSAVCTNLLPVFSELCYSKPEKNSYPEPLLKSTDRSFDSAKKPDDKVKSKETLINSEAFELSCESSTNVMKHQAKICKDKVGSDSVSENSSSNTKSLVNWMTAPDIRSHGIEQFSIPELFSSQNFDFLASSSVSGNSYSASFATSSIDQLFEYSSSVDNNKLYNPNYPAVMNQTNVWSPSKNSLPHHAVGSSENNFIIPSTLPTLIGDLALGTNTTPFVDAFKVGSFEMMSDNFMGQRIGEPLLSEGLKSNNRPGHDQKLPMNANEEQSGARCKIKENTHPQNVCSENKVADSLKSRQPNKLTPPKKPDLNDKSQQTSGTNFLSVSQLVDQNQVKSNIVEDNQFSVNCKLNSLGQKQTSKSTCNFFNNSCGVSNEKCGSKYRHAKKGIASAVNSENSEIGSNARIFNQTSSGNKIEASNGWQHQNSKESSSLDGGFKSNNYSAESLLNNDNSHSQAMNHIPVSDFHIFQNCSVDKSVKLQSSSIGNHFIPSSQPYTSNPQVSNVIPASNQYGEQFPNQSYRTGATNQEKSNTGYYASMHSSQTFASSKNSSDTKPELNVNFYPAVTNTSPSTKNLKDRRLFCKQTTDPKNPPNVELNHGISSYINPPFSRPPLATTFSISNSIPTDPVYTNTPSSLHPNKVDNGHYCNESFLKPCVSISDYAPFDDCNFKAPQNPLSITNAFVPPSTSSSSLYLPHTSLPCNTLPTSFKGNTANFPNFLTVSSYSLTSSKNNLPNYTSSIISCSTSATSVASGSNFTSSSTPASTVITSSNGGISTYLPTFMGTTSSFAGTTNNFSNYLSPVLPTTKSSKKAASCSIPKSASSGISNYLPTLIPTTCITSCSNKLSYLPPVISNSSLGLSQNNTDTNYLPNILPSTCSTAPGENGLTNYLSPVIATSNSFCNSNASNYLPPVLPALNDASLYMPLNTSSISTTCSSISSQHPHPSSTSHVSSTTNTKATVSSATYLPYSTCISSNRNVSSTQNRFATSGSHSNTPSYQPYIQNVSASSSVVSDNSTNYLPVFSNKASDPVISSSYVPVFSNASSVASSSSYLPIFSNSSSDRTIISSNYLPLPNNQGHNSFPTLNTYTSTYLPSSSLHSSNYFPVTLNSAVSNSSQVSNSTPSLLPNSTHFSVPNSQCSSENVQSSNYAPAPVSSRASSKSCKSSPGSCKNYPSAKKPPNSSEVQSSEVKKAHSSTNKLNQSDLTSKTSEQNSSTESKLCNPCGPSKIPSSSNPNSRSNDLNVHNIISTSHRKSSTQFETSKSLSVQQSVGATLASGNSSAPFSNAPKASAKTSSVPPMLSSLHSGSFTSNNCIYSTPDNTSYNQIINVPNSFQTRSEFSDQANFCPLPGFSNDVSSYSIKNSPSSQKYVPQNEQMMYNSGSHTGSSSLTNFNLSAILPEMDEKLRCRNSTSNAFTSNAQGAAEQTLYGKCNFNQFFEKRYPTSIDKKGHRIPHAGQNLPPSVPHLNNAKPVSSVFQNNLETS